MENNKCVYVHKDKEGVVRYVGSGTIERANLTCANSYRGRKYSEYVNNNGNLFVDILVKDLTKLEAEDLERTMFDKHIATILNHRKPSSVKIMTNEMFEQHLYYDETSKSCLRWKNGRGLRARIDSEAGWFNESRGYYGVMLEGSNYLAHRIVAVLHGLDIENKVIDHIDRDRTNNKISNLRVVSQEQNTQNTSIRSDNTSGVQCVSLSKRDNSWVAFWTECNKLKRKSFPILRHGSSLDAFQAAVEHREKMVRLHYI